MSPNQPSLLKGGLASPDGCGEHFEGCHMTITEPDNQSPLLQDAVRQFNESAPPVVPVHHWERPASGRPAAVIAAVAGLGTAAFIAFDREALAGTGPSGARELVLLAEPLEIALAFGGATVVWYIACRLIQTVYRGLRRNLSRS
ncbi:MAG: hypothetical protein GY929_08295 [Actinomycetia bacterium]|nr:hypothetical protein [Actinomycetes bacterium]